MDPYDHEHRSKHHHRDRERHKHRHHHHHRRRRDSWESSKESTPPPPPPPMPPAPAPLPVPVQNPQTPVKNFKLIVDPCLVKGATKKIYRFDGIVAGEPSWNVSNVKDPRPKLSRLWTRDVLDLPVPRFKIDKNYVGDPPEVEICITNVNDNIDKAFLTDLVSKYGDLEEVSIFYHPVTRKHTGNARVVFTEVTSALNCVTALHQKSVMGKSLNVVIDPLGKEWMKIIKKITKPDEDKEESPTKGSAEVEAPKAVEVDLKTTEVIVDAKPAESLLLNNLGLTSAASVPEPPSQIFSVPPPTFNRPPPIAVPPTSVPPPWPPRPDWPESNTPWNHPPPPIPSQWPAPPPFSSPPPVLPPQPTEPAPPEIDKSLDLDTRIELLLKGGINGMAPPFLALEEEEEKKKTKPSRSRSSSVSIEEEDEPLPPGVDVSPSYSPTAPVPSLCEHSSDKYLPLSTPPSPFLSEEEYLESLLKWRLRHLSFVQQEEEEERRKKSRVAPDKVSEISSEEDEAAFAKNDDQMSLSSLSSVNENIEEVAIPSNPYGSYHSGEVPNMQYPHYPHHPTDPSMWQHYANAYPPGSAPIYPPYGMNTAVHPEHYDQFHMGYHEPVGQEDLLNDKVGAALDRVCELMTATLERDIMKRLTEVLAFNEFEKWWEGEERKYREAEEKKPEKENDVGKDDVEEKKSTTDALLNAIIDSNLDSVMSGFTLGFRAALPKMPSFRKKQIMPQPRHNDSRSKFDRNERNESDDEEMVKLSDSESRDDSDDGAANRKKRLESVSSSSLSSSSEASESEESDAESIASDAEKMAEAREELLSLIDDEKMEELRSKTPEDRLTPLASDDFSDLDSKSSSRASSPGASGDLKRYAMEALAALGLDEFVESVKIRDKEKHTKVTKPSLVPAARNTVKREKTKVVKQPIKPVVKNEPMETSEDVKVDLKEEVKEEGEISVDASETVDVMETSAPVVDIISAEHSYSRPVGQPKTADPVKPTVGPWILDHDYTSARAPVSDNAAVKSSKKERKKKSEKLVSHLLDSYLKKEPRASKTYPARDPLKEMMTCYEFLTKGVDQEDINYMKKAFEVLLKDESQSYWLSQMHWAHHPVTDLCRTQSKRSKGHQSGCARTQGFYKLDPVEKRKLKHHYGRNKTETQAATEAKTWTTAGREARSHQRRLLTAFGALTDSDLLKFNQLKFRKKLLKFSKSEIHDWGLFAKEPIVADEMVIEYVGQKVRPFLADYRETKYQKSGIGSSYLFRIDLEHIVDATTCGNLARFINHSCNPNCYAKIITIESEKKIVIYSKRDIKVDEEITYDYKFPLEEEKIACLCGDAQCKGFLN